MMMTERFHPLPFEEFDCPNQQLEQGYSFLSSAHSYHAVGNFSLALAYLTRAETTFEHISTIINTGDIHRDIAFETLRIERARRLGQCAALRDTMELAAIAAEPLTEEIDGPVHITALPTQPHVVELGAIHRRELPLLPQSAPPSESALSPTRAVA